MRPEPSFPRAAVAAVVLLLVACSAAPPSAFPPAAREAAETGTAGIRYRCERGDAVFVLFANDTAELRGLAQGSELLLRDAGGMSPRHSVYSNPRLRAEFGLGPAGDEALLHPLQPAAPTLRCTRS